MPGPNCVFKKKKRKIGFSFPRLNIMGGPCPPTLPLASRSEPKVSFYTGLVKSVWWSYKKLQYCGLLSCWCRILRRLTFRTMMLERPSISSMVDRREVRLRGCGGDAAASEAS